MVKHFEQWLVKRCKVSSIAFRIIDIIIFIIRHILIVADSGNSVVFSDEELRKKYDLYGEEGLKDDHFGGGHYQSWTYFNEEFGELRI